MQDDPSGVTEAGDRMIDEVSLESWERFQAARARALQDAPHEGEEG
jgi:hypothetical protein